MTTRKDMKRRLKASAKRRSRRTASSDPREGVENAPRHDGSQHVDPPGARAADASRRVDAPHGGNPGHATVDIGSAIAETILGFANERQPINDRIVLAALRSCHRGTIPSGDTSQALADQLAGIPEKVGVRPRAFRKEVEDMLTLAGGQRDSGIPDPFLQLLRLLAK